MRTGYFVECAVPDVDPRSIGFNYKLPFRSDCLPSLFVFNCSASVSGAIVPMIGSSKSLVSSRPVLLPRKLSRVPLDTIIGIEFLLQTINLSTYFFICLDLYHCSYYFLILFYRLRTVVENPMLTFLPILRKHPRRGPLGP